MFFCGATGGGVCSGVLGKGQEDVVVVMQDWRRFMVARINPCFLSLGCSKRVLHVYARSLDIGNAEAMATVDMNLSTTDVPIH